MKLVFIHGRDQQGKDPLELKKVWMDTLNEGLEKQGLQFDEKVKVELPFYGDVLNNLVVGDKVKQVEGAIAKGGTTDSTFFYEFINELKDNARIPDQEILRNFEGHYIEQGPLNWKWVQAILQTLDKTKLGTLSIKTFTYDVFLYSTVPGVRSAIDKIVAECIPKEECVVVGHSLGSIVGYNVLLKHQHSVKKYITVGSPLGLKSIKTRLSVPLKMPDCVGNGWYNAYDDRDVVALNPLDSKNFNITPLIENKSDVNNRTKNRHGIEGYLDNETVSLKIYQALNL